MLHVMSWFSVGRWIDELPSGVHGCGVLADGLQRLADVASELTITIDTARLNEAVGLERQ